eukprot:CAMPEP_0179071906 /NCGR_PEP_ID=MMETSP0796-20121207/31777_1 /TAXON_ID=73915 /ORGANISM="Pyrodinium bahamense, Strain pbaha01" /LENGTH=211 /DNA_ID=CAMNT_0020769043 /DNA_START=44 /DNA_END=676 /DNA_ORIENTATION=-
MNIRLEGEGKFWEIVQEGQKTISAFGQLGSAGKTDSQIHYELAAANRFCEQKVKEKLRKGYKECGRATVCPNFLKPKHSADFAEGTITNAKNGTPRGMVYECEAQVAALARKDCLGYFVHKGYSLGETYHLLVPGVETWKTGSHGALVKSVKVKKAGAAVAAGKKVGTKAGAKAAVAMKKMGGDVAAEKKPARVIKVMKEAKPAMKAMKEK